MSRHTFFKVKFSTLAFALMGLSTATQAVDLTDIQGNGPYNIAAQAISATGFGKGTIYSPKLPGKYALVAVCPGYLATESSITDISMRLATHGFVVVTIGTKTLLDYPSSRASQLLAALKAASKVTTGPAAGKIDSSRQVVAGWSMGGGGALEAAAATPGLKAAVSYAPWNTSPAKYKSLKVPSAIIGGDLDAVAPVALHSNPFYDAIPPTTPKLLGVIQGAGHFFPNRVSEPTSYTNIAWIKRFADGDVQYADFLNGEDHSWSSFRSHGPF